MVRPLLFAAPLLLLSTIGAAQTASLTQSGGVLGSSADFTLQGDPLEIYILMPSLTNGPTPLSLFDPADPRSLDVGLDQMAIWSYGFLDGGGQASVSYSLSSDPALHGLAVYAQFVTWPGTTTKVDDISNFTAFTASLVEDSTYAVGLVTKQVTGQAQTALSDGRILISGGVKGATGVVTNELEIFDPRTYSFTKLPEVMSIGRTTHTATLLADGRVLICGGTNNAGAIINTVDIWDPVAGTVTAKTPMKEARSLHTATLLPDGRVFVAGGTSDFDFSDILGALNSVHDSTEVYDPAADTWTYRASLPDPRVMHSASLDGSGRVLITGGIKVTFIFTIPFADFTDDCRAYNPGANAMQNVGNFSGVRAAHAQLTLPNGDVLVVGGADGNLLTQVINPLSTCRKYSYQGESWTSISGMSAARAYPSLVDAGGTVVVIGGLSTLDITTLSGTPVVAIQKANAAVTSWVNAGSMLRGRPLALSTAFDGGRRILTVGTDGTDRTAEVYAVQ